VNSCAVPRIRIRYTCTCLARCMYAHMKVINVKHQEIHIHTWICMRVHAYIDNIHSYDSMLMLCEPKIYMQALCMYTQFACVRCQIPDRTLHAYDQLTWFYQNDEHIPQRMYVLYTNTPETHIHIRDEYPKHAMHSTTTGSTRTRC
jgi:hypothetical protein